MKLVIASNNRHKVQEIKAILKDAFDEIVSMNEAGFYGEIDETGDSFRENALIKARTICGKLGCAAIADDSGLEVYALNLRPGVYSARFAGYPVDDDKNNQKLLDEMKDVPEGKRGARFACCIALCYPGGAELVANGYCEGEILFERRGSGGFGYDPLFYMEAFGMTMAEMPMEQKNKISHRHNALAGLRAMLENK
jgi:XTP/dITP diphosphohydrolase